jgi:hypothetical protein
VFDPGRAGDSVTSGQIPEGKKSGWLFYPCSNNGIPGTLMPGFVVPVAFSHGLPDFPGTIILWIFYFFRSCLTTDFLPSG